VQRWLDAYAGAWETYNPEEIGSLFAEQATYLWHPWDRGDDVATGRSQIVEGWLHDRDPAGTYEGSYEPLLVAGDVAIATGTSRYYTDATKAELDREYWNLWVLRFDADGLCSEFTEWYMKAPPTGM